MPARKHNPTASAPAPAPPVDLDLRSRCTPGPLTRDMKRFDIFLIDTGWNAAVSKAVRSHVGHLHQLHPQDSLYVLTPEQSLEVIKRDSDLIGCDPTIIAYDRYGASSPDACGYCGFRLNLGLMRHPEQALARLQEFVRFISHNRTAEHLDREIRRELHREGIEGIVKILRETTVDMLME
jgi:hypothetical protein